MSLLGVIFATLSALGANVGFLCKQRGAVAAPRVAFGSPLRSTGALFASRWWTIGFAIAAVGWLLHVAALAVAPLSLVQAVIAGGLVLLSWPAERWFGHRLGPRQWLGLGLAAGGLALLAATTPGGGAGGGYSTAAMISFEAGVVALGTVLLVTGARGRRSGRSGLLMGVSAGLLLGVCSVAVKALASTVPADLTQILSPWTAVAIAGGAAAFLAVARALQVGEAIGVIAVTSVAANCAAIVGAVIVFGDPLGSDVIDGLVRGAAFAAVIGAAALVPAPRGVPAPA